MCVLDLDAGGSEGVGLALEKGPLRSGDFNEMWAPALRSLSSVTQCVLTRLA